MANDQKLIKEISKYSDQIGGFAGKYGNLVASCDGVGTKILLAQIASSFYSRPLQSIGIDCVAMVVNDLLCKGAKPDFFLDYYASDDLREQEFYQVLAGIQEGCEECDMKLLGGETAELNDIITIGNFDVCGFGVGTIIDELPKLESLMENGKKNSVKGLKIISGAEVSQREHLIRAAGGLIVPSTGIIDSHALMHQLEYLIPSND